MEQGESLDTQVDPNYILFLLVPNLQNQSTIPIKFILFNFKVFKNLFK